MTDLEYERRQHYYSVQEPYCIRRLEQNKWVVLNRRLVPVGDGSACQQGCDLAAHAQLSDTLTEEFAIKWAHRHEGEMFWLYDDSNAPWCCEHDERIYRRRVVKFFYHLRL